MYNMHMYNMHNTAVQLRAPSLALQSSTSLHVRQHIVRLLYHETYSTLGRHERFSTVVMLSAHICIVVSTLIHVRTLALTLIPNLSMNCMCMYVPA